MFRHSRLRARRFSAVCLIAALLSVGSDMGADSATPEKQTYTWTLATDHASWSARYRHISVVFNNEIFLMSGEENSYETYLNDVWYSTDGVSWNHKTAHAEWSCRGNAAATTFQDKLWILGGLSCPNGIPINDVWSSEDGVIWTQAAASAAWPAQDRNAAVMFQNKSWIVNESYWDAASIWCSSDGINWELALAQAPWSSRIGMSVVIYKNALWLLGGRHFNHCTEELNDVWCTTDGVNWIQITSHAPWQGRFMHTSVVYDNKLWVLGGEYTENGCSDREYYVFLNDVWYSSDGVNWTQTDTPPWAKRSYQTSVVYDNKLWIMGGRTINRNLLNDVWYMTGGTAEGEGSSEGEGTNEGSSEGEFEGQGCSGSCHTADQDHNDRISLSELLRIIQFYFTGSYHCDPSGEDGYAPGLSRRSCAPRGTKPDQAPDKGLLPLVSKADCTPHNADYNPQDWTISLNELLRLIQLYNSPGYHTCPGSEDGFCPGLA